MCLFEVHSKQLDQRKTHKNKMFSQLKVFLIYYRLCSSFNILWSIETENIATHSSHRSIPTKSTFYYKYSQTFLNLFVLKSAGINKGRKQEGSFFCKTKKTPALLQSIYGALCLPVNERLLFTKWLMLTSILWIQQCIWYHPNTLHTYKQLSSLARML